MKSEPDTSRESGELEVYRGDERVGTLGRTDLGARFAYDSRYADTHRRDRLRAVAFSLPVRPEPFEVVGTNLHPFFAGLLPEGLRLKALVRGTKTSEDDLFTLLAAAGGNTVGDVWVQPAGADSTPAVPVVEIDRLRDHTFEDLLARSLDWRVQGDSITVAGVQPKVSAAMISFPLRARSRPRDYILKLSPPDYPRLVENEYFFMQLARSLSLSTAVVKLVSDGAGESGLLVERFDRVQRGEDQQAPLARLHQEDACQLLNRYPADKYRLSTREIAAALDVCSAPTVERLRLLQLQALSYLIGNGDLHGKNISVQVVGNRVALTPIYDLVSTLPYGDESLALKIEGRDKRLRREDLLAWGERVGLRRRATERMLDTLVRGVGPHVGRLEEIGLEARSTRRMERVLAERLAQLS